MKDKGRGLLAIHSAVFLFGVSGLFGKLLVLSPLVIVFGRTFFGALALSGVLCFSRKESVPEPGQSRWALVFQGIILAFHWTTFFHAIQISTVAVGIITYSTFPLFVTFMEPIFFKERLRLFDVCTGVLIIVGLILVVPTPDFENSITRGAFWGVVSGFSFAVLQLLNRRAVNRSSAVKIACYQNSVAAAVIFPALFWVEFSLTPMDVWLLIILGVFCTALAHALFIMSLVKIKTQLASLTACLESVYGIVFAVLFLGEKPDLRTLAGGALVLGVVAFATRRRQEL
jgi:drug/metabolite transporter (DMT)-like permease